MANVIKLKNSGTANSTPTSLEVGELAINYADGILYYKNSSNAISILSSALYAQGASSIEIATTPPASPSSGDLWFESDTGTFYVFDGTYWVEVSTNVSINAESAQDAIAPLLNHGFHENITATYNDASNKIILSASAG